MAMTKAALLEKLNARGVKTIAHATTGDLLSVVATSEVDLNILYKASLALIARRHNETILERGGYSEFARSLELVGGRRSNWTIGQIAKYMRKAGMSGETVNRRWKEAKLDGRHYPFVERVEAETGLA